MRVILVDDEKPSLEELAYLLGKHTDVVIDAAFTKSTQALNYITDVNPEKFCPDVIFLDIDMPGMHGIELAHKIKIQYPDIMIVFITAYRSYALESFKVHPVDYILKPIKEHQLNTALDQVRRQVSLLQAVRNENPAMIRITCFGHFNVQLANSDIDIKWGTRRVKDLFMYLIDQAGLPPTRHEIIKAVFGGTDDKRTANNLYVTMHKLRQLLHQMDPEEKHLRLHDNNCLEVAAGVCDYTDFVKFAAQNAIISRSNALEAAAAMDICQGGYLPDIDYWWADQTARCIDVEYERIALSLAGFYWSESRQAEAEKVLGKLITRNPVCEEGYSSLLDIYMKTGNDRDFIIIYNEYVRVLKKEMGVKPNAKYTRHCNLVDHT